MAAILTYTAPSGTVFHFPADLTGEITLVGPAASGTLILAGDGLTWLREWRIPASDILAFAERLRSWDVRTALDHMWHPPTTTTTAYGTTLQLPLPSTEEPT